MEDSTSPERYQLLRRRIIALMIFLTVVPLSFMAIVNYYQYQASLADEVKSPLHALVNKTKHSIDLFLDERLSILRFINSAYSFKELSDEHTLNRIFRVLRREFGGFVDLGLINNDGIQVSYAGPYDLLGKNYSKQRWFQETSVRGVYISDVFMGYRNYPHISISVKHLADEGHGWVIRATIDTGKFDNIIASMGLDPGSDAFLINSQGTLQTNSKLFGNVLESFPLATTSASIGIHVSEETDARGHKIFMALAHLGRPDYTLVVIKPQSEAMRSWYTLKSKMFFIFIISVGLIVLVVFRLTRILVRRIQEADEKREFAFRELEHSQKLSSIGRLAAGVAHEINNPLAIINEDAGLMHDLIDYSGDFQKRQKFLELTDSILQSVERCRIITHRLLGFARRLEVKVELLDLHKLLKEVLGFLANEAANQNIEIRSNFSNNIPLIYSDQGQLQQVFLNILNNALASVAEGGFILVSTNKPDTDYAVGVSIEDNGCGMSEETLKHIFEPFFTIKKEYGTGLGLPITYGIIKNLGGNISVRSKEGEGTIFMVDLPKKPAMQGSREENEYIESVAG